MLRANKTRASKAKSPYARPASRTSAAHSIVASTVTTQASTVASTSIDPIIPTSVNSHYSQAAMSVPTRTYMVSQESLVQSVPLQPVYETADILTPVVQTVPTQQTVEPQLPVPTTSTTADLPRITMSNNSPSLGPHNSSSAQDSHSEQFDLHNKLWDLGHSPIKTNNLHKLLINYPDRKVANILGQGFEKGFLLNYQGPRVRVEYKNMKSAIQHSSDLEEKIKKEIGLGRVLGPFSAPPISNLRCSPVGLLPKKQGGWRMITNLSHPYGDSVNDYIDQQDCTVSYASFDDAINIIQTKGKGALMAKMDISSAFRLLPINPQEFCLLGFKFNNSYYIDKCLPMGCSVSCSLFEKFSSFLHWELEQRSQKDGIVHYLDDFFFAGSANSSECRELMYHFQELSQFLGVPIAPEKTQGPCTKLTFLGLGIDSVEETIFVPKEEVDELLEKIKYVQCSKKVTKKELESLVGSLAFVVKALPAGRAFCRRIYGALQGVDRSFHLIRISNEIKLDLQMWVVFLQNFNGLTRFPSVDWSDSDMLQFYTDSSGSVGCGVVFGDEWSVLAWPASWSHEIKKDITLLELIPILLGIVIWAEKLASNKLLLHVDNLALVHIINNKTSKNKRVMVLLRALVLKTLQNNIQIKCQHIQGIKNDKADALSRFQFSRFHQLAPGARPYPCPVPMQFWQIIHQL